MNESTPEEQVAAPASRHSSGVCTLLACADPYRVGVTAQALAGLYPRVETAGNGRDLDELALELCPDLVILDRLLPGSDTAEVISKLVGELPDVMVVVLTEQESYEECLRFYRAGARGYLDMGLEPSVLVEEIDELLHAHQTRRTKRYQARGAHHPGIWAFCGASDGDGRTSLVLSAAWELARHGEKVAVLDLDLLFGDLAFFLGVPRVRPDLSSLLEEELFLEPRIMRQHVRVHPSGIHLYPAPFSTTDAAAVNSDRLEQLVEALPRHYDHVLLDLPCGLPDEMAPILRRADLVMLVGGASLRSLKDMLVLERLMAANGIRQSRVRGLLTKLDEAGEIEPVLKRNTWIEFGLPKRQQSLKASIEAGQPFPCTAPMDPYCIAVRRLVTIDIPNTIAAMERRVNDRRVEDRRRVDP
jgi:pilus assembly protein CpaE